MSKNQPTEKQTKSSKTVSLAAYNKLLAKYNELEAMKMDEAVAEILPQLNIFSAKLDEVETERRASIAEVAALKKRFDLALKAEVELIKHTLGGNAATRIDAVEQRNRNIELS